MHQICLYFRAALKFFRITRACLENPHIYFMWAHSKKTPHKLCAVFLYAIKNDRICASHCSQCSLFHSGSFSGISFAKGMIPCISSSAKNVQFIFAVNGNFTAKVVPFSELDSTQTFPPCSTAISLTSASPRPTPPICLLLDLSTRKNG